MTGSKDIGRGKSTLCSVEKYKVEDDVLELYKQNIPATQISLRLEQKGVKISPLGIRRWLDSQRKEDKGSRDIQNRDKFENMVIDYKTEITGILNEVNEMRALCKEKNDLKYYDKMLGRLYQGLELLAKLMGDIKPSGSVDINIIINDINKRAFNENRQLRSKLHGATIIDVEAEVTELDEKHSKELQDEKTE